jgi:F5/8 type C domain
MNKLLISSSANQRLSTIIVALNLLLLTYLIFFLQGHDAAFSQLNEDTNSFVNSTDMTTIVQPSLNDSLGTSESSSGFVANGKINTVINVPNGKWIATGNWSIIVNNGNVTSFDTKMTWYNSSGTNAHTHDLTNFKANSENTHTLPNNNTNKQTIIEGFTDVDSNGRTSWFEVPTQITINDGKIISISLDDNKTNHHFGAQPLLGIVDSFYPCSDIPGPNMELLPPCSPNTQGGEMFGLMNDTTALPPSEEYMPQGGFPGEDLSQQGIPEQSYPGEDLSEGGQSLYGNEQSGGSSYYGEQQASEQPRSEDETDRETKGEPPSEDETDRETKGEPPSEDDQWQSHGINSNCTILNIENITANGFETDPSDYHPPSDAVDGNPSTWWSNNGDDPWLEIHLDKSHTICGISVEWNKGDQRDYSFEIQVSEAGNNYEKIFEGANKQGSSKPEVYPIAEEHSGKFVRITVINTSSEDGWVSIKEVRVLGLPQ